MEDPLGERKMEDTTKKLIENVDKVADWFYQRKMVNQDIPVAIFKELVRFVEDKESWIGSAGTVEQYRNRFAELTDAYEAGDLILAADILHFEFAEGFLKGKRGVLEPARMRPVTAETETENRRAFAERYGLELPQRVDSGLRFDMGEAKDGSRILYVEENGQRMRLNSAYDPSHEAMRWAAKYDDLENVKTTIVLQGLLNGFFLRALELTVRSNVNFIVYEPSEAMFLYVVKHYNLTDIFADPRVRLVVPSMDMDAFYQELSASVGIVKSNILGVITPGYARDDGFSEICRQIQIIDEAESGFREHLAKDAFWNTLYAFSVMDANYLVYDFIQTFPKDIPIIMVAGGPSLLKNAGELKRAKGKALIVAIERAVSVLLEHGIVPDMMVTIDPTKDPGFLDYEEVSDTYLLCGFGANRVALQHHNGHLVLMHSDVRYNEMPGLDGRLLNFGDIGGGVAPAAFIHFLYMRTENLILVGQDLAFDGDVTHADGRNDDLDRYPLMEAEGIHGGTVKTRWDMDRFRNFMERKMREYPSTAVTDATEGGALIHGTKVRTLRETIDELCTKERDIAGLLRGMPHAQTAEQHDETVTYMCLRLKELRDIKQICPKIVELCRAMMRECRHGDVGTKKSIRRIDKINKLRNRLYAMKVNDWLEETWVTDRYSVPDPYWVVQSNEEAYPVFEGASQYYAKLPEYCDSLGWVIKDTFGFTEEEYERRIADVQAG